MDRSKAAARFAAFVWFLNRGTAPLTTPEEAGRLAREHWQEFLPCADEQVRRLVCEPVRASPARRKTRRKLAVAH